MRQFRNLKIASLIEHELTKLILKEIEIMGVLITILGVEVSDDLLQAKVKVSVIPHEKELEVYEELQKKRKEFQHMILKKSKMKFVPTLEFLIESKV